MAERQLVVFAKVKDGATEPLKNIETGFKKTGEAVKQTGLNLTQFNKTMFSATAFIGMFSKALSSLGGSLAEAGDIDRLSNQYERVIGPKGELFKQISGLTTNTIDKMEAMRAGIALKSTGIVTNVSQMANIIAKAGTAGKRAGLNSAEGIKQVTNFMKDGSVAHLAFLNVLAPTNVALQSQMAILNKAGGMMGGVISTQARLRMGMAALSAVTGGMNEETRDLSDVLQEINQTFNFMKASAVGLVGKALTPLLIKMTDVAQVVTGFLDRVGKDLVLQKVIKNVMIVTATMAGLLATMGSLSLVLKALGSLGIGGVPFLVASLFGLAGIFGDMESAMTPFTTGLKLAGSVMMGVFQLVSSFLGDSDNFDKGIGKMDRSLAEFLQKNGLLELTKNIATVGATIVAFIRDTGNKLLSWFDYVSEKIKPLTDKFKEFFTGDHKNWSRSFIEGGEGMRGMLLNLTATALGLFAALKIGGGLGSILGKIPGLGGFFGGSSIGKGPKGTSNDPIYTATSASSKVTDSLMSKIFGTKTPTSVGSPTEPTPALGTALSLATTNLGLFAAALTASAAAGYGFGTWLNSIMSGTAVDKAAESTIDTVMGWLGVSGSSAEDKKQADFMNSPAYKNASALMVGSKKQSNVENTTALAKQLEALASSYKKTGAFPGIEDAAAKAQMAKSRIFTDPGQIVGQATQQFGGTPKQQSDLLLSGVTSANNYAAPAQPIAASDQAMMITTLVSGLDTQRHDSAVKAWKEATKDTSAGGQVITPEEWQSIFIAALDQAQITKHTKETAKKKEDINIAKARC